MSKSRSASNGMDPEKITYFGQTDSRGKRVKFGIKAKDRSRHTYVIGKTGMGKSTLLENMAIQDLNNGEGMIFVDPHGKTAELLIDHIPAERIKDVIYFAPFDTEYPISFNVMEDVGADKRHLVVNGLMSAFKKLFGEESFSDRMQYILQNTILALLEYPNSTLLGINRMLTEKPFREKVIANITDASVKSYWTKEFAGYTDRFAAEATPAIQNKIGQFTSNPLIRNIVGQEKSSFDFRKIMDEGKIMIINLSKGRVGEANANLLGSMLITKIYLAAMSRADLHERDLKKLPGLYLYVDEFQSFANESFADILSEARKYKLNLIIAHQYIEQMTEEVRAAVFGNVGTFITFRIGAFDAEVLEKEFAPQFTAEDLVNLGIYQMYLKLMIDGVSSQPFSASSLAPFPEPIISYRKEIIEFSRNAYAKPRSVVEENIHKWMETEKVAPKIDKKEKDFPKREEVRQERKPEAFSKPQFQQQTQPQYQPQAQTQQQAQPQYQQQIPQQPKIEKRPENKFPEMENSVDDEFVSIKDFAKKVFTEDKNEPKIEKKENKSDLKNALQDLLNKQKPENKTETKTEIKQEVKTEEVKLQNNEKSREIPEEDLRKILND